jgi:hypothetical protein
MLVGVGLALRDERLKRKRTFYDVEKHDGPSYKTVQTIEEGTPANFESLDKCAHAMGLEIVDVLNSVLEKRVKPLSPEAAMIVRVFNETTVDLRMAFVALANAGKALALIRQDAEATDSSPQPAGEPTPPTPPPPRPAPKATRRRKAR